MNRKKNNANTLMQQEVVSENLEPKYKEILQNIINSKRNNSSSNSLTNIIGSGIKFSFYLFILNIHHTVITIDNART